MKKIMGFGLGSACLALAGCNCHSHRGVVGVAYQSIQTDDYPTFYSTLSPDAQAEYGSQAQFQQYQAQVQQAQDFKEGPTQVMQQQQDVEVQQTIILTKPTESLMRHGDRDYRPTFKVVTECRTIAGSHERNCQIDRIESLL